LSESQGVRRTARRLLGRRISRDISLGKIVRKAMIQVKTSLNRGLADAIRGLICLKARSSLARHHGA